MTDPVEAELSGFRERCITNDYLWKLVKVALGGADEFPVDIDGMLEQITELRKENERLCAGLERLTVERRL